MRINQFIVSSGLCSRRAADRFIESGKVTINGKVAELGSQVEDGDDVKLSGRTIKAAPERICILVNKPLGITSTTDKTDKTNIIDYVNYPKRLFTVGRLDKDSTGAILLTNDGTIVNKLLRSENEHTKTYIVEVDMPITQDFLKRMATGVKILNAVTNNYVVTKPCKIKELSPKTFEIILTQGYNRQIRRMCEALGYKVRTLNRTKFLFLTTEGLKVGSFRKLTKNELEKIDEIISRD